MDESAYIFAQAWAAVLAPGCEPLTLEVDEQTAREVTLEALMAAYAGEIPADDLRLDAFLIGHITGTVERAYERYAGDDGAAGEAADIRIARQGPPGTLVVFPNPPLAAQVRADAAKAVREKGMRQGQEGWREALCAQAGELLASALLSDRFDRQLRESFLADPSGVVRDARGRTSEATRRPPLRRWRRRRR